MYLIIVSAEKKKHDTRYINGIFKLDENKIDTLVCDLKWLMPGTKKEV